MPYVDWELLNLFIFSGQLYLFIFYFILIPQTTSVLVKLPVSRLERPEKM